MFLVYSSTAHCCQTSVNCIAASRCAVLQFSVLLLLLLLLQVNFAAAAASAVLGNQQILDRGEKVAGQEALPTADTSLC